MIVDKKNNKVISGNKSSSAVSPTPPVEKPVKPQQVSNNGPMDVLRAIKEILRSVTWEYGVDGSPTIFKTF